MITMKKVATFKFTCEPFHSDFLGHLTLSVLGNHLLNCAGQHATERGFGMARINEEKHTWVLSRMAIEFDELPNQYDSFEIDTWIESVYRLFTNRNFSLRDKDGRTIGFARTVWAMIGLKSRKPIDLMNLYDGVISSYNYPDNPCPIDKPGRIKVTTHEPSGSFVAHYSDIDINGHVNSIRYIEHVMDLFSLDHLRSHRLHRFEIAYVSESYFGDKLNLFMNKEEDLTYSVEVRQAVTEIPVCRCKLIFKE